MCAVNVEFLASDFFYTYMEERHSSPKDEGILRPSPCTC